MNLNETHTFCNEETMCQFINELPYGFECQLCSFESDNSNIIMSHMKEKHSNEIMLSLKKLHSDETQNIVAITPFKYNVKTKNQKCELLPHIISNINITDAIKKHIVNLQSWI